MGILTWTVAAMAALLIGRAVRVGLRRALWIEAAVAISAALACGALATALDFGGWGQPDWRAGAFALIGSFAAIGATRIATHRKAGHP